MAEFEYSHSTLPLPAPSHKSSEATRPARVFLTVLAAATALVAACGSATSLYRGASTGAWVVSAETATVRGSSEQVLNNSIGDTLYYNTQDSATSASCTGSCASTWPPLLLSSGQPTASYSLPQALTTVRDANGRQVEYGGHPLYTYSGDSGPDRSHGEGLDGIWYVATPSLGSASSTPTPSASARGGY
jgi:predicted lipoprotein with Yx(FWY)xxD motif